MNEIFPESSIAATRQEVTGWVSRNGLPSSWYPNKIAVDHCYD